MLFQHFGFLEGGDRSKQGNIVQVVFSCMLEARRIEANRKTHIIERRNNRKTHIIERRSVFCQRRESTHADGPFATREEAIEAAI